MSIEQVIEDADYGALYEICERAGYNLGGQLASEDNLRATVLDDYQAGRISGREIAAAIETRKDLLLAANRIIAENVREFANMRATIRKLEERIVELQAAITLGQFEIVALMRQAREHAR